VSSGTYNKKVAEMQRERDADAVAAKERERAQANALDESKKNYIAQQSQLADDKMPSNNQAIK
jgi:hypothetical protein